MDPLLNPNDLVEYPGAPFSSSVVRTASGIIRDLAGWHIAPEVTQTIEVDTDCSRTVLLPTMQVKQVDQVRNLDTGDEITGWRLSRNRRTLTLKSGTWPQQIEVDLVHGYSECPDSLRGVLASMASQVKVGRIRQETIGSRSITLETEQDPRTHGVLAKYTIPPRP